MEMFELTHLIGAVWGERRPMKPIVRPLPFHQTLDKFSEHRWCITLAVGCWLLGIVPYCRQLVWAGGSRGRGTGGGVGQGFC